MNMFEIIKTRRSTRAFKAQEIENELVENIIDAARFAPSGGNNQSNHFIVIKNKKIRKDKIRFILLIFRRLVITKL